MIAKEGFRLALAAAALLAAVGPRSSASAAPPDRELRSRVFQFAVSPDGSTVWIPSKRTVVEVNAQTGETMRRVRLGFPVSGVARNAEGTFLGAYSATQGLCTFITLDLLRAGATAGTAPGPTGADFDPGSSTLCVLSPRSLQLDGIDTSGQRLFTVPLDTTPFAVIHAVDTTLVTLPARGILQLHNHEGNLTLAAIPGVEAIAPLTFPGETYYDPTRTLLYVTSRELNQVAAINADGTGSVGTVDIDMPLAVVASGNRASFLHGAGSDLLSILDADPASPTFLVRVNGVQFPEAIEAIAVASATGDIFALSARDSLYRVDPVSGQVTQVVAGGGKPTPSF